MIVAKEDQYDPVAPTWIHAVSRCVRRAYLACEKYEHRKDCLEQRLRLLAEVFAVQVAGYAVMSNHPHVVLRMQPEVARGWSVVERWWTIYPRQKLRDGTPVSATAAQIRQPAQGAAGVETRRKRLADPGWLMRGLDWIRNRCPLFARAG